MQESRRSPQPLSGNHLFNTFYPTKRYEAFGIISVSSRNEMAKYEIVHTSHSDTTMDGNFWKSLHKV